MADISVGDLMMFLVYLLMLLEPLLLWLRVPRSFKQSQRDSTEFLTCSQSLREMVSTSDSIRADRHTIQGNMVFEDVSFVYPGTKTGSPQKCSPSG